MTPTRLAGFAPLFALTFACGGADTPPAVVAPTSASADAAQPVGETHTTGHQHHFADPAAYAERWESEDREEWQRPGELVAAMGILPGMRVADIGTGTGYLLPWLSAAVGPEGTVYATDLAPEMLAWVDERIEREALTNVVTVLSTEDGPGAIPEPLDRAVMINVWHHIDDRAAYAASLLGVLRPGGEIFVVETRVESTHPGPPRHYRLAPEAVIAELESGGLEAVVHPFEIDRQYVVVGWRPAQQSADGE